MHDLLFGKTPPEQWVDVDDALREEIVNRLARLGYDGDPEQAFASWAGTENLEERIDGLTSLDPVVLRELRSR